MKVIDLLNKIANGEEVPKKINYNGVIFKYVDNYCYCTEYGSYNLSDYIYTNKDRLNDEVEILDEPLKIEIGLNTMKAINSGMELTLTPSKNEKKIHRLKVQMLSQTSFV